MAETDEKDFTFVKNFTFLGTPGNIASSCRRVIDRGN
jgi:hypothetical protein